MKRSEMVKKLAEYIINNQGGYTASSLADMYISYLENSGMVPPGRINGSKISYDINYQWDKEDEKY